ncbi:PadR family transcriptional regulator [Nocardiopsis rhodophaea]|uniref:PadR family transcriptional regulator n=1 Tax=Nocardiopsis rhodophaea TaxID=280238 RepID=A0ABN2S7L2_9ACTN
MLELAVLGHLAEAPMHGYELRKRLNCELGAFRAFSYGSLYPCLKEMQRSGLVTSARDDSTPARGRRSRIVYRLTSSGRDHLLRLLAECEPATDDDECFGVHFTLFARTRAEVRLRILAGRRNRLQERLDCLRQRMEQTAQEADPYVLELNRYRAEALEREVGWLDDLVRQERHRFESRHDGQSGDAGWAGQYSDADQRTEVPDATGTRRTHGAHGPRGTSETVPPRPGAPPPPTPPVDLEQ